MRPWRVLAVALAVTAVGSVVFGTGGFGAVDADRDVDVSVVDDEEAYVGVVACEKPKRPGETVESGNSSSAVGATPVRLWVTNRYGTAVEVVEVRGDGVVAQNRDLDRRSRSIEPGEEARFEFVFPGPVRRVTVTVDGDAVSASVARPVRPRDRCPRHAGTAGGPSTRAGPTAA